jgi:hypothetical protein
MNDLYPVILGQNRLSPFVTADYQMVKFNGDSRGRQGQFTHEIAQRRSIAHFPVLTIDLNQQCLVPASGGSGRQNNPAQFGGFTVHVRLDQNRRPATLERRQ